MFDVNQLLEQVKDPRTGLPLLGILMLLNVLFGVLAARKAGQFDRQYLLSFIESRILYQGLPVGAVGFAAIYLAMPLLSWVYVSIAVVMAGDLFADLLAKVGQLFPSRQV